LKLSTALIASTLIASSLASGAAHAALQGRDLDGNGATFEAYYDTDLDITWLADANYAKTSGYTDIVYGAYGAGSSGAMTWADAKIWAANLSFTDGVNIYDNWRLPTTLQPDVSCDGQSGGFSYGYGCTGSELGHLFYSELGGTAGQSILTSSDPDLAKFTNLPSAYWSTESESSTYSAWYFNLSGGYQYVNNKFLVYHAWVVSPGDVAAVPEAQTYALMLAGLGLIGWRARRRG
jgi:hypothetical protein